MFEESGHSRTLGRVFAYLMLAEKPKTLDQIAQDLLFSKATASLTVRQGQMSGLLEKVGVPGERKDYFRMNQEPWTSVMGDQMKLFQDWKDLIDRGSGLVEPGNQAAGKNLQAMKDFVSFIEWYYSGMAEAYEQWKKEEK